MIWLLSIATRAFGWLRSLSPSTLVIIALCASCAVLWRNASGWRAKAETCATGRAADRKAYADAQAEATRRALAEKTRVEAEQESARKDADEKLETARDTAAGQLARYVRMRRPAVARDASGGDMPRTAAPAEVDNGTGGAAIVDVADLAICTDNTARLVNARDWAAGITP